MKEQHSYKDLHPTEKCYQCSKPIKKSVVERKKKGPFLCYKHYCINDKNGNRPNGRNPRAHRHNKQNGMRRIDKFKKVTE